MSGIGPQRATPKRLSAINAENSQLIEKFKELILSEAEKGKDPDWIKETELYKSFQDAGCYIHHGESGVLVIDPTIIYKCNF